MQADFQDFAGARPQQDRSDARRSLQAIRQQAASAEMLTSDPHWDTFLSYLQSALDATRKVRDALLLDLANPALVNPDQVAVRRIGLIRFNERMAVLSEIMSVPAELKKTGTIAVERLKEFSDEEASNEQSTR